MFVDGLSVLNYSPSRWKFRAPYAADYGYPTNSIPASFGNNQQLEVTLRELTRLTGLSKYQSAARAAATYALNNLRNRNGMLYWGHFATYDASHEVVVGLGPPEEVGEAPQAVGTSASVPLRYMNALAPDYRYLYGINPSAIGNDISQMFKDGIFYWQNLSFKRILSFKTPGIGAWERSSVINTNQMVPFPSQVNMSHWQYASPYIHGGLYYYQLTGDERAWKTVRQMIERFVDVRNPETNLGPGLYGYRPEEVSLLTTTNIDRYKYFPAFLLKGAELYGVSTPKGSELLRLGIEELVAFSTYMHVSGTDDYRIVDLNGNPLGENREVLPGVLWNLALGYRLSRNDSLWQATRDIIKGYGLGDIGTPAGQEIQVSTAPFELRPIENSDHPLARDRGRDVDMNAFVVHALVELYEATGRLEYISMAENAANSIVSELYDNGLFVRQKNGLYGQLAHMAPLALIHLEAAKQGKKLEVDSVFPRYPHLRIPCGFAECTTGDKYWDGEVVFCRDKVTGRCPIYDSLQFTTSAYNINEGGGTATITVSRTGGSTGPVSVGYSTATGGTATEAADYLSTSGTLTWTDADVTPKTFTVPIGDDGEFEGNETVSLALNTPNGATLGTPRTATLNIIDDDQAPAPQPGSVQFTTSAYNVSEGGGTAIITASRTGGSAGPVSVGYTTDTGGTATEGGDYIFTGGILSWADGDATDKTFTVSVINDSDVEGDEIINLFLSNPSGGATLGTPNPSTLTIIDDEQTSPPLAAADRRLISSGL
jgi:hypothetical protein